MYEWSHVYTNTSVMKKSFLIFYAALFLLSCNDKIAEEDAYTIGTIPCQVQPAYLTKTGLNPKTFALSTSEKRVKGLVAVEFVQTPQGLQRGKTWKDESWSKFGYLGPITTDDKGNSYVAPVPVINILENKTEKQNVVYKVDTRTAEMKPLAELPVPTINNHENPYGVLSVYFDCDAKLLYVSSVSGSDRTNEQGVIYIIDPETGIIKDQLKGIDAMGLCVGGISGEKRLYIGSSRNSNIYSIELTKAGKFTGKIKDEFSLDMLGPRGDDKARRIRFDKNGAMQIYGVEFNYNLTAATEKQETLYQFRYNDEEKKWTYMSK